MGIMHVLVVVLIIFEGIIIQCEGTPNRTSLNQNQASTSTNINDSPNDLIEVIFGKIDYEKTKESVRLMIMRNATDNIVMSELLKSHTGQITPEFRHNEIYNFYRNGQPFLRFGSLQEIDLYFKKFGGHVKKMEINYGYVRFDKLRNTIYQCIIENCAKSLDELRVRAPSGGIWDDELSNAKNDITFPKVKKFKFSGQITRSEFKLKAIFHELESVKLSGMITDRNCLENVTTLNELTLWCTPNLENHLHSIFENNKNIKKLSLLNVERRETIEAIKEKLELETFDLLFPGSDFLFQQDNQAIHNLTTVQHFKFSLHMENLDRKFSFDMPELKKLTLSGTLADDRIIGFIKHYKKLKTLELKFQLTNALEYILKFNNIEEFTARNLEYGSKLESLQKVFKQLDKKSELRTLKLLGLAGFEYQKYVDTMTKINHDLNSEKPTWALSREEHNGQEYLMFKR